MDLQSDALPPKLSDHDTYIYTYIFVDRLKWLLANLYAVGPAGYQIRGVLMDASLAYDLLCCLT